MNPTFTLEEIGFADAPRVGEEAASLGEILKIGAHVPAAFVIPTTSYAEYLNYPSIKSILSECDPSNQNELKTQLLAAPLPKILERSIRSSYRTLSGPQDTFVSVRAGISEQRAIGEEELIYNVKKLWVDHLARLCSLRESLSLNPLPILVQQIEMRDLGGILFTSDPYSADPEVVAVEVNHYDGRERFFFEKGTDRLTKRMVTGIVEEETPLETVSSLSSWAMRIEKILKGPQELKWGFHPPSLKLRKDAPRSFSGVGHQEVPVFLSVKPLYLRKKVPAAVKLWVQVTNLKEVVLDSAEGIVTTTADNAVKLAKKFPTKPVLLALEVVEEEELAIIKRARHRERQKNLHLILPPVRTVDGLRGIKRAVAGEGLPRSPRLKFYFRVAFPVNVVLLDRFLELEMDGVVFDAKHLTQGFLGTQEPVEPDESLFWALGEVQQGCRKAGLDLLYLGESLNEEVLANLLRKGMTQIITSVAGEEALLSTLMAVEGKLLAARSVPYQGREGSNRVPSSQSSNAHSRPRSNVPSSQSSNAHSRPRSNVPSSPSNRRIERAFSPRSNV